VEEMPRIMAGDLSLGVSSIQDHQDIVDLNFQKKKHPENIYHRPISMLREHQDNFLIDERECNSML
jgi:hypothetical protein